MTYGHEWLRPLELGKGDPNGRIVTCDIEGIRHYMCPTSGGDIGKCRVCPGLRACTVGQRVEVLRSEKEKQEAMWRKVSIHAEPVPKKSGMAAFPVPTTNAEKKEQDRELFREACESGNAWGFLINRGYSEGGAKEKLIFWVKQYPGIASEFGGRKHIIKKTRTPELKIVTAEMLNHLQGPPPPEATGLHDVKAEEAEAPVEIKAEEETVMAQETPAEAAVTPPEPGEANRKSVWSEERKQAQAARNRAKTEAQIRTAIASGDPIEYLMTTRGNNKIQAQQTLRRWQKGHPEFFEAHEPEPEGHDSEPENQGEETESDIVSLEDFLAAYTGVLEEPEQEPENAENQRGMEPVENPNRELARLMQEEAELLNRIADLQTKVWDIREKRKAIEEKMSH